FDKLKGAWTLAEVSYDDTDKTSDFQNVIMTISGGNGTYTYRFSGTFPDPSPWPIKEPGSFTFSADNPQNTLVRDDGLIMTYNISGNQLTIAFDCAGCGYQGGVASGRTKEINGNWRFVFTKA